MITKYALLEVSDHKGKALAEGDCRLPAKEFFSLGNVGLALVGVILSVGTELDGGIGVDGVLHHLGQLQHGELARVAKVEGPDVLPIHQPDQTLHQV